MMVGEGSLACNSLEGLQAWTVMDECSAKSVLQEAFTGGETMLE
jgi:hypothetical protein